MLLLLIVIVALVCYFAYSTTVKPKNYPPGPSWIPFVGCDRLVKQLTRELNGLQKAFAELSKRYRTGILGLKMGRENIVVITSFDLVRKAYTMDEFTYRPISYFLELRSMGTFKGITGTDGKLWSVQRNFLVKHLKKLGFGKSTMDEIIMNEFNDMVAHIEGHKENQRTSTLLASAVLNILWQLVAGTRIAKENPQFSHLLNLLDRRAKAFDMSGGLLSQYPWLRHIAPEFSGYKLIVELNMQLRQFLAGTINEHYATWYKGRDDDLIHSFITEMRNESDPSFTYDQLIMLIIDMFIAGSQTTSNSIEFAILCMIRYPDVQKKLQHLIDSEFGDEVPEYKNRNKAPYIEAVINEVMRIYNIVPVTNRRVIVDVEMDGYVIPKDTTILLTNEEINYSVELWGDPETFRPERFIDDNGELKDFQEFMPFNIGKRRCLGDVLAKGCIFTFLGGLLQKYTISLDSASPKVTGIPKPGITLTPEPFTVRFTSRK